MCIYNRYRQPNIILENNFILFLLSCFLLLYKIVNVDIINLIITKYSELYQCTVV